MSRHLASGGDTRQDMPVVMQMTFPTLDMIHTLLRYAEQDGHSNFILWLSEEDCEEVDEAAVRKHLLGLHGAIDRAIEVITEGHE